MPAGVSDNPFLKIESLLKLTQVTLSQGLKAYIPYFGRHARRNKLAIKSWYTDHEIET